MRNSWRMKEKCNHDRDIGIEWNRVIRIGDVDYFKRMWSSNLWPVLGFGNSLFPSHNAQLTATCNPEILQTLSLPSLHGMPLGMAVMVPSFQRLGLWFWRFKSHRILPLMHPISMTLSTKTRPWWLRRWRHQRSPQHKWCDYWPRSCGTARPKPFWLAQLNWKK